MDPWCYEGKCYTGQAYSECAGRGVNMTYGGQLYDVNGTWDGTWCFDERRDTNCVVYPGVQYFGPGECQDSFGETYDYIQTDGTCDVGQCFTTCSSFGKLESLQGFMLNDDGRCDCLYENDQAPTGHANTFLDLIGSGQVSSSDGGPFDCYSYTHKSEPPLHFTKAVPDN